MIESDSERGCIPKGELRIQGGFLLVDYLNFHHDCLNRKMEKELSLIRKR